jgi:hypothetical protein
MFAPSMASFRWDLDSGLSRFSSPDQPPFLRTRNSAFRVFRLCFQVVLVRAVPRFRHIPCRTALWPQNQNYCTHFDLKKAGATFHCAWYYTRFTCLPRGNYLASDTFDRDRTGAVTQ